MPNMLQVMESWDGVIPIRGGRRPDGWNKAMSSFIRLVENTDRLPDHVWEYRIKEAMGTSDFPLINADTIDRQLLAEYQTAPRVMRAIARLSSVRDFRAVKRFAVTDSTSRLQEVPELGEYQASGLSEGEYTYSAKKYGEVIPFSWESFMNDDLGAYGRLPGRLSQKALNTEEWFITNLFWDANGPRDAYFAAATGQAGVSALPLTPANLKTAITEMCGGRATYAVGEEGVVNVPRYLVVPPALQLTAEEILKTTNFQLAFGGTITPVQMSTANVIAARGLQVLVNAWLPSLVTSGTKGSTTWALFSESIAPCEFGNLRGHETPELCIESATAQALSGGADPFNGSFRSDSIKYRVRYCFGGCVLDPRGGWASDGQ